MKAHKEYILLASPRFNRHYFCHLLVCFVFALLSACGGGGGGSSTPDTSGGTSPVVDNSGGGTSTGDGGIGSSAGGDAGADGTAGDGAPIVGGLVTITDANGLSVTATTNLQGYYSAKISNFKSPLIGNVTKGSRTLYTFSTKVAATNKTVTINITGITDKIVSDIAVLAGKDSARKITAADIVANASNLAGIINAVNNSIASILTANGLNPATFDPINTPFLTNHKGYDAVLDALQITNGPTDPTRITPLTPLEATQQLFKALRDTAGAYSNTANTGELDTAGNTLETAINNGTLFSSEDTIGLLTQFSDAAKMYDNYKSGASAVIFRNSTSTVFGRVVTVGQNGSIATNALLPEYRCELAQVTTTVNAVGDTDLATYRFAGIYPTSATSTATLVLPAQVNAFTCYTVGVSGRLFGTALNDGLSRINSINFIPQPDGSYKYISQTLKRSFDLTGLYPDPVSGTIASLEGLSKFGMITATKRLNGDYTNFNVSGQLTPGIKMLNLRTVAERAKFKHETVNLSFAVATGATQEVAAISGTVNLIKADDSVASSMVIGPNSTFTKNLATTIPTNISGKPTGLNLAVSVSMPDAKFEGTITAGSATSDITGDGSRFKVTDVVFVGKLYQGDGAGGYRLLLNGKIEVSEPEYALSNLSNPFIHIKRNTDFDGKIYLKNRPEMSLVLAYKTTSQFGRTMIGNFTWDGGFGFDIASSENTLSNTGFIRFTSVSGVTFTLPKYSGAIAQPIYKNGVLMGNFTLNSKRINFTDGRFEQF